jgi:hypothetical protein
MKNDSDLRCDMVKRLSQCNDEELKDINELKEKCDIYQDHCKMKCEIFDEDNCGKEDDRKDDCIWLKGNETKRINSRCADKVLHKFILYIICIFVSLLFIILFYLLYIYI